VTLLRYGLLGPGARRVRLVGAAGQMLASTRTSARIGGAYLFAVAQPVAPYVAANHSERAHDSAMGRAVRAARARGASEKQAIEHAMRSVPRSAFVRPPDVGVVATFAGGQTLRVAGHHRSPGQLPGLGSQARGYAPPPPPRVPVAVRIAHPGRFAVVTLSFVAPVAVTRFDASYTQTLHGPIGLSCTRGGNGYNATPGDVAKGETVRFTIQRPPGFRENGRQGWCRGRFTGHIRYSTPGRNITIGRFAFRIR
jgi:hypothetical protein